MRKLSVPVLLVALVVLAGTALIAVPASKAPEKATIDDCVVKKTAVDFPHGMHAKTLECKTCHHTQPDLKAGAATEVETCGSCHVTPAKAETPKCSEMGTKTNPFHVKCVGCHKEELAKKADTKAPTKCEQCHPKA
jgi:hypothetical protein